MQGDVIENNYECNLIMSSHLILYLIGDDGSGSRL